MVPHIHKPLAEFLTQPYKRKQLTLPRGFLKTTTMIGYSLWRTLPPRDEYVDKGIKDPWHDPNLRILYVQNMADNARKRVNMIKGIVQKNQLFQTLFPEIIPENFTHVRWSDSAAELRRDESHPEATFEAAGVGTSLVSRHYSIIVEDDIVAARSDDMTGSEAMPTREEVEKAIGFHKLAISLLANPKEGEIINVGTRWSKYDVIEHIVKNQIPPYERFVMSAEDENGDPTYPERFDKEVLQSIKEEQGTYIYSSQYLNQPVDVEKMVFQESWFKYYDIEPTPESGLDVFMSVDPAISRKKGSDNSVVMCAGVTHDRQLYVLEYTARYMNPSELIAEIFRMYSARRPKRIYVETVAYQEALAHFLKQEAKEKGVVLPIVEYKPGRGDNKEARIRGVQPIAMSGRLHLKSWMKGLKIELVDFPYAAHDDIADALAIVVKNVGILPRGPQKPKSQLEGANMFDLERTIRELRARSGKTDLPFKDQLDWSSNDVYQHLKI